MKGYTVSVNSYPGTCFRFLTTNQTFLHSLVFPHTHSLTRYFPPAQHAGQWCRQTSCFWWMSPGLLDRPASPGWKTSSRPSSPPSRTAWWEQRGFDSGSPSSGTSQGKRHSTSTCASKVCQKTDKETRSPLRVSVSLSSHRMRIALSDYGSLEEVLRAVRDLPYDGGDRRTGDALQFLVDHVFSPAIVRDHAPKVRCIHCSEVKTQALVWRPASVWHGLFSERQRKGCSEPLKQSHKRRDEGQTLLFCLASACTGVWNWALSAWLKQARAQFEITANCLQQ